MRRNTHLLFVMIVLMAFSTSVGVQAQSSWQGNAVTGDAGEFPEEGLYAASNTFPRNQMIEVTNLETDETVSVMVLKRVDEPGIFLVLSGEAGGRLGMSEDEPSRVEARPIRAAAGDDREPGRERVFSEDPDMNPGAALSDEELYPEPVAQAEEEAAGEDTEPSDADKPSEPGDADKTDPPEDGEDEPSAAEAPRTVSRSGVAGGVGAASQRLSAPRRAPDVGKAEPPAIAATAIRPGSDATAPEGNEVERALRVVRERSPGKDMFPAPRDRGIATFITPPARRDEELGEPDRVSQAPVPPTEGRRAAESLGRIAPPDEGPAAELPSAATAEKRDGAPVDDSIPPAVSREDELRAEGVEPTIPDDAVISLEPAEERPPEGPAPVEEDESPSVARKAWSDEVEPTLEEETVSEEEPSGEDELSVVTSLERDSYYLQVAAFQEQRGARSAVEELGSRYPTEVLQQNGDGRTLYRVLVGPLNEDESGTTLYHVRAMGYEDAFIRTADG